LGGGLITDKIEIKKIIMETINVRWDVDWRKTNKENNIKKR